MNEWYDPRVTPWDIDDAEFYELESEAQQIRFLLRYAILAPSRHNTQPWLFRPTAGGVEICTDAARRLPATDPDGRELLLSSGAAIANLRIAAANFGFETSVRYTRKPDRPDMVAFIAFRETSQADPELRKLFPAIRQRHTNRQPFEHDPVEPNALEAVCDAVDRDPETLRLVASQLRPRVADLVTAADELQMAKSPYRRELSDWTRASGSGKGDGMAADGLGFAPAVSSAAEWVLRHAELGSLTARRDRSLIDTASALIVVAADDNPVSLVAAGEIMERLLLTITRAGLHYSFFNAPVEVDDLRQSLWTLIGTERPPQLLLRVGHAHDVPRPMPRRPVDDVLL